MSETTVIRGILTKENISYLRRADEVYCMFRGEEWEKESPDFYEAWTYADGRRPVYAEQCVPVRPRDIPADVLAALWDAMNRHSGFVPYETDRFPAWSPFAPASDGHSNLRRDEL